MWTDEQQEMKVRGDKDGQTEVWEGLCKSQPASSDTQLFLIAPQVSAELHGRREIELNYCPGVSTGVHLLAHLKVDYLYFSSTQWRCGHVVQVSKWPDIAVTMVLQQQSGSHNDKAITMTTDWLPWQRCCCAATTTDLTLLTDTFLCSSDGSCQAVSNKLVDEP